ncbi:LysE family translocator [Photorhabdus akhurstii]|uniref:LysE family translocator n=1 Tax=Photorhabdus akhurstii TaxID=171438 RepID=UPI001FE7DC85|nr:LysE family transporter [Photorhabdus akhurstii]
MNLDLLYFYLLLVVLSYITPGPDWAIISKGTFKCRKHGIVTAIGVQAGLVFHLILGSLGATLILATSKTAFNMLQTLGALYLIYLGYSGLKDTFNSQKNHWKSKHKYNTKEQQSIYYRAFSQYL